MSAQLFTGPGRIRTADYLAELDRELEGPPAPADVGELIAETMRWIGVQPLRIRVTRKVYREIYSSCLAGDRMVGIEHTAPDSVPFGRTDAKLSGVDVIVDESVDGWDMDFEEG